MIDSDLRRVRAVGEPVRSGAADRSRSDLRVVRASPQLLRACHRSAIGARLHLASVVEEVAHVGSHGDQDADRDQQDGRHGEDLASLAGSLLDACGLGRRGEGALEATWMVRHTLTPSAATLGAWRLLCLAMLSEGCKARAFERARCENAGRNRGRTRMSAAPARS